MTMSTRRSFLRETAVGSALITAGGATPRFLLEAAAAETAAPDRVLVVLQLSGGNDGLNTVVPYDNDEYYKARPKLAIARDDVLKIDDHLGFHPEMAGMAALLESDRLAILQGIGYDNPNRSHFESMDVWHTCDRKEGRREDGWLGRYLDGRSAKGGDVGALHLGREKQPRALLAQRAHALSVASLDRFRLRGNQALRGKIESLAKPSDDADDLLGFVQANTSTALVASKRVEQAAGNYKAKAEYPDSRLAEKLKTVAQLIDAGLGTRVYYVALDGFDTHSQQANAHSVLVRRWAGALQAFLDDTRAHGHGERVLAMCFSEFGRRVKENASEGTDHGAAAPMFLAGDVVQAGVHGAHPAMDDLQQGDLKHHTDFRQVYAEVLQRWLRVDSGKILGGEYRATDVLRS